MENNDNHQSQPSSMQQTESVSEFKRHNFPLKSIMKSDPNVEMVSVEASFLFSKAFEMFLAHLTKRSWLHADENQRRTLLKSDISAAVARTCTFDFLVDVLHKDADRKNEGKGGGD